MIATGSYIRTLRVELRLTQEVVIERAAEQLHGRKIDSTTLWRIETGQKRTRSDILAAVVAAVQGDSEDVAKLMRNPDATIADGRQAALARLTPEQETQVSRMQTKLRRVIELADTDPVKLEHVIEQLRADAQADPAILDMVMAYLDGRRSSTR